MKEAHMASGEHILLNTHQHWSVLWREGLVVVVAAALSAYGAAGNWFGSATWTCIGVLWVLVVVVVLGRLVRYWVTTLMVSGTRIVLHTGLLKATTQEIPIDKITTTNVTRHLYERVFGCGDLVIEAAGRDAVTRLRAVPHVLTVQRMLHEVGSGAAGDESAGTPVRTATLADQLEKLQGLLEKGVLTTEEFSAAKAKLLG
jgi:uncharacterized membrane protein YdbT with pleckstrin-like domain